MIISNLTVGGAENSLLNLVSVLRERHEIEVVSLRALDAIGEKIQALGIKVHVLNINSLFSSLSAIIRLVSILRRSKPDLVHTWMYHADLLGGLCCRLVGIRNVVWSLHSSTIDGQVVKPSTMLVIKSCAILSKWLPKKIIACSQMSKFVHAKIGYDDKKIFFIPNGVDLTKYSIDQHARSSVLDEFGIADNVKLVGIVGRYNVLKNHHGFISAAAIVFNKYQNVRFFMVGREIDGNNLDLVKALGDAGISNVCLLLGQRDDIPRLMASFDVLALSSIGEAFPLVLLEAMACGTSCVTTDVGDAAYIVADTGVTVESGNMRQLAEGLLTILELSDIDKNSLGRRARLRVEENFSLSRVADLYDGVYLKAVQ